MSAPGPRAGSSARYGMPCPSANDPVTVLAASRASPPGMDPIPVAALALNPLFSLTRKAYGPDAGSQRPGRTVRSLISASRGRSSASRIVVATDSGSIQREAS